MYCTYRLFVGFIEAQLSNVVRKIDLFTDTFETIRIYYGCMISSLLMEIIVIPNLFCCVTVDL